MVGVVSSLSSAAANAASMTAWTSAGKFIEIINERDVRRPTFGLNLSCLILQKKSRLCQFAHPVREAIEK